MNREIGSEFWLIEIPNDYAKGSPDWINMWGNSVLTSSGRGAISLMLKGIENNVISKTALLPAYICESIIMPFIKEGYVCYFYDVDNNLKPNTESINIFLKKKIGVFLHLGYFGFPTNINLRNYIIYLKKKGTIIVEDLTHTLFSKYERYIENDYYIASLRKWTGLPSGGFLASKHNNVQNHLDVQTGFSNIRERALLLKGDYIKFKKPKLKQKFLDMFDKAENILNDDVMSYLIDNVSHSLINELDTSELIKKRRKNFIFLSNTLKEVEGIKPVFKKIPDAICPLFFPVYIEKGRKKFKDFLISKSIYCPVYTTTNKYFKLFIKQEDI